MINKIKLLILSLLFLSYPLQTFALTSDQRFQIERENFYDPTACTQSVSNTSSSGSTSGATSGSKVYILGDSITVRSAGSYTTKLNAKGITPTISARIGRSWDRPGQDGGGNVGSQGTGSAAVQADKDTIAAANTVVIALGTNGTSLGNPIDKVIASIKLINPNADIYWVNIAGSFNNSGVIDFNKALADKSSSDGFTVIDWAKVVDPSGNGTNDPNDLIDNDGIHPNTNGINQLTDLVVNKITTGGGSSTSGSEYGQCCDTVGSTALNGSDNKAKIYNYFINKGLTSIQAAAITGNIQAESAGTFDPRIVEYGFPNSRGEISERGKPSSLDDNIPPSNANGQPGYGLVQWSGDRKNGLQQLANSKNLKPSDLGVQLDYIWQELNGSYKSSVLDPIKASTSLEQATYIWLEIYEVPTDIEGSKPIRRDYAQNILQDLSGGTSSTTAGGGTDSGCGTGNAVGGSVAKIIEVAQQELATAPTDPAGIANYIQKFQGNAGSWCADFVSYVLKQAGSPFNPGTDNWHIPAVNSVQAYFKDKGTFHAARSDYIPKPGDIVIYNQGFGDFPQHVDIIISMDGGEKFTTIGGNEGNKVNKVQHSSYNDPGITGFGTIVSQ